MEKTGCSHISPEPQASGERGRIRAKHLPTLFSHVHLFGFKVQNHSSLRDPCLHVDSKGPSKPKKKWDAGNGANSHSLMRLGMASLSSGGAALRQILDRM